MTDIEIDKALALAIGWKECDMILDHKAKRLCFDGPRLAGLFDHRDWNVIGPIAEKYNAFPVLFDGNPKWYSNVWVNSTKKLKEAWADTPQKAIALAVIGALK